MPVPAQAQATRTWVSGVGDDANPCSRTAPCKTFAGAISKTAAKGEISVLDPGGYGAVTITKAISITSDPSMGGILNASTTGVIINAGSTDVVNLRGLIIEGAGSGLNGIRFLAGKALHVEDCVIRGNSTSTGHGIVVAPSAGVSELLVTDTMILNNGTGSGGGGILIKPTGSGAVLGMLQNVTMSGNVFGLKVDGSTSTGTGNFVTVKNSTASGNGFSGFTAITVPGASLAAIMAENVTSANNGTTGLKSDGPNAFIGVAHSTISSNAIALQFLNGGILLTAGSNLLFGNSSNGAASGSLPPS
jgi:hypothetical protein